MDRYTRPDPDRAALLTIDTQNDFTLPGAPAEIPGTAEVIPAMSRLVEAFRSAGQPVIHVVRLYRTDGSNVDACRRASVAAGDQVVSPGTNGAELVDGLKPDPPVRLDADRLLSGEFQSMGPQEWVMYKPRWGAFYATPLEGFLADRDVDTVVVCGCNFPNCPRTTIYEASERDYRIVFVPEATSGTYDRGLVELEDIDVAIKDVGETAEWLSGGA